MKKVFFVVMMALSISSITAQENFAKDVQVGQQMMITVPSSGSFQHVKIPKKNFIIKKGGIWNMDSVDNAVVNVISISNGEQPKVTLERADGKKFFNAYRTIKANFNSAVNSGELQFMKGSQKASITR
ncbi:Hypothetical protein I595_1250 [Croceitalea dokdonensis DOKDO 023]|uniref:DUF4968 domain-containing protein n=1 Tax=Croceitalea dokdonensis DOKDO 023 TaxID=1300341 RepID=A0A0P7A7N8_9FLAO|nr:hypothetical protein [Croceitalea dokdonensis]KPM32823.1 Hypothetical protein I595_1250 [Croceitalea dokdonensis DOKDO 023]